MNEKEIKDTIEIINFFFAKIREIDNTKIVNWSCVIEGHIVMSIDECNRLYDVDAGIARE